MSFASPVHFVRVSSRRNETNETLNLTTLPDSYLSGMVIFKRECCENNPKTEDFH